VASESEIYRLTPNEAELMIASRGDPNAWASYWLQKPGFPAFQFDRDFTDEGKWQVKMVMAGQPLVVAICGIATGKTLGVGIGACFHASVTNGFRFANIGHELDQSKIMYDAILDFTKDTRFEKLIVRKPSAPHPKIEIAYYIGNYKFYSLLEFYSAGEDQSGENVFSKRYDWINIEEAFRFDNLKSLRSKLRTRLTGKTSTGRPLMGRLSLISNPIDNPELWDIFDDAVQHPEHAATFLIDTEQNKNVTEEQIAAQLADIPEEERALYLKGARPEGRGSYYSRATVEKCSSQLLSAILREGLAADKPGFRGVSTGSLGYYDFRFPREDNKIYIITGDPGIGAAPSRNAPTIGVWEVDPATNINTMRALWWGNGGGSIMPFVNHLLELMTVYSPEFVGIDSTSTQKNTSEIMNLEYVQDKGYSVPRITGMDFSGGNKYAFLVSLRVTLEAGKMVWPDVVTGLGAQLKNYDPLMDSAKTSKLPQDLVAMAAMAARASRALYPPAPTEEGGQDIGGSGYIRDYRFSVGDGVDRYALREAR
jgi:hypothetical protein